MSQSLVKNYIHIIFSTKHRQPFISKSVEDKLYGYLGGICKELDCIPIKIGGYDDHVHILCLLSKNIHLAKLLEKVKSLSSKWIKTFDENLRNFYWQDGYGAFSVNPAEIDRVIIYISNQRVHHQKIVFRDEFRAFLKKYKVEYNGKYVWD